MPENHIVFTKYRTSSFAGKRKCTSSKSHFPCITHCEASIANSVEELAEQAALAESTKRVIFGTGIPRDGIRSARISTKDRLPKITARYPSEIVLTRTKGDFVAPEGLRLCVIDFDAIDASDARFPADDLSSFILAQTGVSHVSAPSSSAGVYRVGDAQPPQHRHRIWLFALSPRKVVQWLNTAALLEGYGAAKFFAKKREPVVSIFDASVNEPWGLEYLVQSKAGDGYRSDERIARVVVAGKREFINGGLQPFSRTDIVRAQQFEEQLICAAMEERGLDTAERSGSDADAGVARVGDPLSLNTLLPIGACGADVAARDVLREPWLYDGARFCYSAIEAGYTATSYVKLPWPGVPHVASHAHGGIVHHFAEVA